MRKRFFQIMIAIAFIIALFNGFSNELKAESEQTVYFIPLEDTVEKGLSQYIKRTITEAKTEKVDHIVLEIDTLGGAVDGGHGNCRYTSFQ